MPIAAIQRVVAVVAEQEVLGGIARDDIAADLPPNTIEVVVAQQEPGLDIPAKAWLERSTTDIIVVLFDT